MLYTCENCNYDYHLSPAYVHGDYSAHREPVKRPPEVLETAKA